MALCSRDLRNMKSEVLLKTEFKDLKLFRRGKVRDVYDLGDKLLIVSTEIGRAHV